MTEGGAVMATYQAPSIQGRSWYVEIPTRLTAVGAQLTGSDAALYTAPSAPTQGPAPKVEVRCILLTNTDSSARTVTLQIRTGASATATHICSAKEIAAKGVLPITFGEHECVLEAGEIISGLASSANVVNIRISGVVFYTSVAI